MAHRFRCVIVAFAIAAILVLALDISRITNSHEKLAIALQHSSGNFPNKPSEESVNSVMSPLSIPARLCEMMRFATSTYFPKNHTDDSRSAEVCVLDDVEAVAHDGGLVVRWWPNVDRSIPVNGVPLPDEGPAGAFVVRLMDGIAFGDTGAVMNRSVFLRGGRHYLGPTSSHMSGKRLMHPRVPRLLTLSLKYCNWFQHFVHDCLPRIELVVDMLLADPSIRVLIQDTPEFMDMVTEVLGNDVWSPSRWIIARPDTVYPADEILYPHWTSAGLGQSSPGALTLSASKLRVPLSPGAAHHRHCVLYMTRHSQRGRKLRARSVGNQRELLDAVEAGLKPDMDLIVLQDPIGWRTYRHTVSRCAVMFGPHGGALSSMLFMHTPGTVLEFIGSAERAGEPPRNMFPGFAWALNLTFLRSDPLAFGYDTVMKVNVSDVVEKLKVAGVVRPEYVYDDAESAEVAPNLPRPANVGEAVLNPCSAMGNSSGEDERTIPLSCCSGFATVVSLVCPHCIGCSPANVTAFNVCVIGNVFPVSSDPSFVLKWVPILENRPQMPLSPPPSQPGSNNSEAAYIFRVRGGVALGDSGAVMNRELVFEGPKGYARGIMSFANATDFTLQAFNVSARRVPKLVALSSPVCRKFSGFVLHCLPRIELIAELLASDPDVYVLIDDTLEFTDMVTEVLGDDVWSPSRWIIARPDTVYPADEILYPHWTSAGLGQSSPGALTLSTSKLRVPLYPGAVHHRHCVLYMARKADRVKQARHRFVVNEGELLDAVEAGLKPDMDLIVLQDPVGWRTYRHTVSRCAVMFGPHGGALSSMLFMHTPGTVLEFIGSAERAGEPPRNMFPGFAWALNLTFLRSDPLAFGYDTVMKVNVSDVVEKLKVAGVVRSDYAYTALQL